MAWPIHRSIDRPASKKTDDRRLGADTDRRTDLADVLEGLLELQPELLHVLFLLVSNRCMYVLRDGVPGPVDAIACRVVCMCACMFHMVGRSVGLIFERMMCNNTPGTEPYAQYMYTHGSNNLK